MLIVAHDGFPRWTNVGADFLEIDIRRNAQGNFILSHDEPAAGLVTPTLDEALRTGVPLQLDLKEPGFEVELIDYVTQRLPMEKIAVTAAMDDSIKTLKESFPRVRAGLTLAEKLTEWTWSRIEHCSADFVGVDLRYAGWYKAEPLHVWLWTVDDKRLLKRFIGDGWPEAIITNRPDVALRLMRNRS